MIFHSNNINKDLDRRLVSIGLEWSTEWQLYGSKSRKFLCSKGNDVLENRFPQGNGGSNPSPSAILSKD